MLVCLSFQIVDEVPWFRLLVAWTTGMCGIQLHLVGHGANLVRAQVEGVFVNCSRRRISVCHSAEDRIGSRQKSSWHIKVVREVSSIQTSLGRQLNICSWLWFFKSWIDKQVASYLFNCITVVIDHVCQLFSINYNTTTNYTLPKPAAPSSKQTSAQYGTEWWVVTVFCIVSLTNWMCLCAVLNRINNFRRYPSGEVTFRFFFFFFFSSTVCVS